MTTRTLATGLTAMLRDALEDAVATYHDAPAVFQDEAPQTAALPYVVWNVVSAVPWDTHTELGRDVLIDVKCYTARTGSVTALAALAETVYHALHNKRVALAAALGEDAAVMVVGMRAVQGPAPLPIEETAIGRVITFRVVTQELPE